MTDQPRILFVDDDPTAGDLFARFTRQSPFAVTVHRNPVDALSDFREQGAQLIVTDLSMPEMSGIELLRNIRELSDTVPVIIITGYSTVDNAIEALRLGATDFIKKPYDMEELLLQVERTLETEALKRENRLLKRQLKDEKLRYRMIGNSTAIQNIYAIIDKVADIRCNVIIEGESGTGKELVARAIHNQSPDADKPFIVIDCGALTDTLLESELFGHEKGAFTGALSRRRGKFERAQGGTLLLDEIGDMNAATQAKLLRVLEEGEMERLGSERSLRLDVRVLASTNRDLDALLAAGGFRRDLYHRLRVIPIHVPPLREHPEDVEPLAVHYLGHFCAANGRPLKRLDAGALARLRSWPWPGNVRELKNLMERIVIMVDGREVGAAAVAGLLGPAAAGANGAAPDGGRGATLADSLAACERRLVGEALDAAGGNVAEAARRLGLDRANLHRRLRRLGLRD